MGTLPLTRISAEDRLSPVRELPRYGGLLYFLIWRDVKVRYKQTTLGVLWALIQPAGLIAASTLAFSRIAPGHVPYPYFVAAGVVPWLFFSRAVTDGAGSAVENERLLTKVYFPRLLLPLSAVIAVLVETAIAFIPVIAVTANWTWRLFMIFPAMGVAIATAIGISSAAAAMNVRYRDARYVIPFMVHIMFLLTPVLYPPRVVPERWRDLLAVNPLYGVLETVRWSLFGSGPLPNSFVPAAAISAGLLLLGIWIFRASEDAFADVI